jgi:heat-inducible transcriptional repressor
VLERVGVSVEFGGEDFEIPGLRHCALVAAPYGRQGEAPLGVLGVIGPSRMDYRRVIPLVDYCSELVSRNLGPADDPVRVPALD